MYEALLGRVYRPVCRQPRPAREPRRLQPPRPLPAPSPQYAIVALVFPYLVLIGLLLGPQASISPRVGGVQRRSIGCRCSTHFCRRLQFHWSFEGSWMGALAWLDLTYVEHRLGYSIFQAIVFATAGVTLALAIAVLLLASIHARQRQPWKSLVHVTVFLR